MLKPFSLVLALAMAGAAAPTVAAPIHSAKPALSNLRGP